MRFVRPAAIFLLAFLALSAFVGAMPMIVYPCNNQWRVMPLSLLQYSPFHTFMIPGILLLVSNSLLPLWVLWRVIKRKPLHGLWVVFQGCVLLGFLASECFLLRVIAWPHYFYASVALALMMCGLVMRRDSASM